MGYFDQFETKEPTDYFSQFEQKPKTYFDQFEKKSQYMSGNLLNDVVDLLSTGQYAVAGAVNAAAQGRPVLQGALSGVKNRESFIDVLQDNTNINPYLAAGLGLVGDVVLDPLNLVTPAGIVKGARAAGKAAGLGRVAEAAGKVVREIPVPEKLLAVSNKLTYTKLAGKNVGQVVDKAVSDKKILNQLSDLQDAAEIEKAQLLEEAQQITKRTGQWSQPMQELMYRYIDAPDAVKPSILDAAKKQMAAEGLDAAEKFLDDVNAVRDFEAKSLKRKQEIGYLPNTYNPNYIRRSYQMFDDPDTWNKALKEMPPEKSKQVFQVLLDNGIQPNAAKVGSDEMASLLRRSVLSPDVREALGEVKNVHYAVAKGAVADANLIARTKLFQAVADNFAKDLDTGADTLSNTYNTWSKATKEGYVRIPDSDEWGALKGKFVPEPVYDQLKEVAQNPSTWQRFWSKGWGYWKFGKTVGNPASHARNTLSNMLMADWGAGLSPARVDIYYKAAKEILGNGELYQEAKKVGTAFIDTFAQRELGGILRNTSKSQFWEKGLPRIIAAIGNKASDAYNFEETLGKMAIYIFEKEKGRTAQEAAKAAEKWLFNYRKVPKWIESMRSGRWGPLTVPFITFSYKALPRVAEAAYKNPTRITKYFKGAKAVESLGGNAEEEKAALPEWMKQGTWLRLPTQDKYGRSLYLDLSYIIPFGDLGELGGLTGAGSKPGIASMPLNDFIQDVQRNQSRFTGQPIVPPGATPSQAEKLWAQYAWNFFAPSIMGYSASNFAAAVKRTPDWMGRTRSIEQALAAALLGLKTRPIDLSEEQMWRAKELEDSLGNIQTNLRKLGNEFGRGAISEKEFDRLQQEAIDRMNALLNEYAQMVGY